MKKMTNTCEHCGSSTYEYRCNVCGGKLGFGTIITVTYGYGHPLDMRSLPMEISLARRSSPTSGGRSIDSAIMKARADVCSDECLGELARNPEKYIDTDDVTVDDIP